jgi:hypothetical protein
MVFWCPCGSWANCTAHREKRSDWEHRASHWLFAFLAFLLECINFAMGFHWDLSCNLLWSNLPPLWLAYPSLFFIIFNGLHYSIFICAYKVLQSFSPLFTLSFHLPYSHWVSPYTESCFCMHVIAVRVVTSLSSDDDWPFWVSQDQILAEMGWYHVRTTADFQHYPVQKL